MNYRTDKYGNKISTLGFGCMRFNKKAGSIDIDEAERLVVSAVEQGVNYFDTAYIYSGSEAALGEIFKRNPGIREKINIATKLPHYLIKSTDGMEKMFNEQLKRLGTDHVDYYLMHMLTDVRTWNRLINIGILDWIKDKQSSGAIRQIGFSYHGDTTEFINLLEAYEWDFCQIQYNYMDEHAQAGRRGLNRAYELGIPVVIMEPLRGGRLINMLPKDAQKAFDEFEPYRTPAMHAFRWLWDQEQVTCVLSGMNSQEMLDENIRTASEIEPGGMTKEEHDLIDKVKEAIASKVRVPCTGCGYCMPCPAGVNIPGAFRCLNEVYTESKKGARWEYLQNMAFREKQSGAGKCMKCGKCEQHCPQGIQIRSELSFTAKEMETPFYKIMAFVIRTLHLW